MTLPISSSINKQQRKLAEKPHFSRKHLSSRTEVCVLKGGVGDGVKNSKNCGFDHAIEAFPLFNMSRMHKAYK